ncbi:MULTISPECIES: glycogen-binding domain-containing protein [Hallerella]|uniref:AMP-activated protein kinase-like protein n=1 Tax=Hallerella succinigenes TaxID=1896222 RepID=A0A2M9A610_9BACT|nr:MULTISPECIES: glycogen-binding domain-containing protein [Hallerella]MBS7392108.1 glycogen-binding domain-containing protein [Fibrobacter sp.]MCI6872927.1 glycogen-binding domain-containing protein [Hallerella sp.]MDD6092684.1 glycogen-binding domain-containing protein [Hallerella succinigenes]MDY5030216.1 glycogen-binding domain-containing protein [Hallerella succinigenes]PJJ41073.1 AMP-activated protein kinase-like protein [Hallerella succinigenes]
MSTPKKTTTKVTKGTKCAKCAPKATAKATAPKASKCAKTTAQTATKTTEKTAPAKKTAAKTVAKTTVKKAAPKASKKALEEVVFNVYSPDSKSVEVAGEFNNWTPAKMKKGEQGVWSVKLKLAAGTYQYKFVFDGSWEIDQANPNRVPDGQGGENSVKNV